MDEKLLAAVDIGGTKLAIGLVHPKTGHLIDKTVLYEHVGCCEDDTVELIAVTTRELWEKNGISEADVLGLGVGFPGHIRYPEGSCITTSNLRSYEGYSLRDELQSHFLVPVFVDNDANAQARGEHCFGAGKGVSNMLFITVSTGIGAGIIIDGKLVHGDYGTAGEVGHTIVNPHSRVQCTCGNYGCVMGEAATVCMDRQYQEQRHLLSTRFSEELPDNTGGKPLDGHLLMKLIDQGDAVAVAVMEHSAFYVGLLVYNMFQTFNPEMIVLGRGLMNLRKRYFDLIRKHFDAKVKNMMVKPMQIVPAALSQDSGLVGSAALVESFLEEG